MAFAIDVAGLRSILAAVPDILLVVDRDGIIRYINRVEPGFDIDEVVGKSSAGFMASGSEQASSDAMASVFETGEPAHIETAAMMPDASSAWYRSEVLPLREDGAVVAVLFKATNITELKAAREAAAQLRKLLPVCAWCDRIRTDEGSWETIAAYLKRETDTDVTHGLCPDCYQKEVAGMDGPEGGSGAAA